MKDISPFECEEYEKMVEILGIRQSEHQYSSEIKAPDRNYLMAWDFGYTKATGRTSAETVQL